MWFPITAWIILTATFTMIASWGIWARSDNDKFRGLSALGLFLGSIVSAVAIVVSVGWSVPCVSGMTAPAGKYYVIAFQALPDDKIHLMLDVPEGPRLCYIPWSTDNAERLRKGQEEGNGSEARIPGIIGDGEPSELQIWPVPPQPDGPPKETQ